TTEDLDEMLEPAVDLDRLSEDEVKEVLHSDVVVRGRRREDGSEVYLVVEVSSRVGPDDVERAARRAEILSRSGVASLAVVAGERIRVRCVPSRTRDARPARYRWDGETSRM